MLRFSRRLIACLLTAPLVLLAPAVPAAAQQFTNSTLITIPSSGPATPYPSTIVVSGVTDPFNTITVTLHGLSHTWPADLQVLLVSPTGRTAVLMSSSGGGCSVSGLTLAFRAAAAPIPPGCSLASGLYGPTSYAEANLPAPAPPPPYGTSLNPFLDDNPNGIWGLFVYDRFGGDAGFISNGWSIAFSNESSPVTYQGVLKNGNAPVSGPTDLAFSLWTDPEQGERVGPVIAQPGVPVQGGLVSTSLNFGDVYFGQEYWLEVVVNGVTLSPRQRLAPPPSALRALHAATANNASTVPWSGITGIPPGFADGVDNQGHWSSTSGGIFFNGNVGINTSNPTAPLSFGTFLGDQIIFSGSAGAPNYGIGLQVGQLHIHTSNSSQDIIFGYGFTGSITERMRVRGNGLVTVGNTASPVGSVLFSVGGNASKPGGGSWAVLSDQRAKRDIAPIDSPLDRLLSLRGVSYEYADHAAAGQLPGRHLGMLAQEVESVFPEWIDTRDDGLKTLTFRGFEALTVEALRDLRAEKDGQIAALAAENADLRARLDRLEALLQHLHTPSHEARD